MRFFTIFFLLLLIKLPVCLSQTITNNDYLIRFDSLSSLICNNGKFKYAILLAEDLFVDSTGEVNYFENKVLQEIKYFHLLKKSITLNYKNTDSVNYWVNYSIFKLYQDTIIYHNKNVTYIHKPFSYNNSDPQGDKDWTNTFVTKLLATHQGNCRSLTYLYKILADELGAKCWLALAPNHIYIRNYSKQIGWYNTELTSGTFPTDAWIAATGYVSTDAIRSGVYMDTLSNQQAIGLCILDLAQGYIRQTNNYTDGFVLKCCNLVLQYHAVNPEALLIKAEALKRIYLKEKDNNNPNAPTTYNEMEQTYITLVKLGYREMPYKTYQKWLKSVKKDKEKYINQKLKGTLNKR